MKHLLLRTVFTIMLPQVWGSGYLVAKSEDLVADGAKPVKLAGGYKFTEGPAVDAKGNVFFTDFGSDPTPWHFDGI